MTIQEAGRAGRWATLGKRKQRVALAGGLALALAGIAIVTTMALRHPGGDPGGVRLKAVRSISVAVPRDAKDIIHSEGGPFWDSCDGMRGTDGWSDVANSFEFTSVRSDDAVVADVSARLKGAGWAQISSSANHGPLVRWTMTVPGDVLAQAQLSVGLDGYKDRFWDLTASAPPAGKRVSGC